MESDSATENMPINGLVKKFQDKAKGNILLWATTFSLFLLAIYWEVFSTPAKRPFSISDPRISNPFVEYERYDNFKLASLCVLLPLLAMSLLILVDNQRDKFHRFYKCVSVFTFSTGLSVFLTTFAKVRLTKLRPDFLARCGPILSKTDARTILYTEEICSMPLGEFLLDDGYKSCPSGHSTLAVSGMLFVSLWLYHTYGKNLSRANNSGRIMRILCFSPMLLAIDICASRIYDFRHDYFDILCGGTVGALSTIIGVVVLDLSETVIDSEAEVILPV